MLMFSSSITSGNPCTRRPVYQRAVLLEPMCFQGALFWMILHMMILSLQNQSVKDAHVFKQHYLRKPVHQEVHTPGGLCTRGQCCWNPCVSRVHCFGQFYI